LEVKNLKFIFFKNSNSKSKICFMHFSKYNEGMVTHFFVTSSLKYLVGTFIVLFKKLVCQNTIYVFYIKGNVTDINICEGILLLFLCL